MAPIAGPKSRRRTLYLRNALIVVGLTLGLAFLVLPKIGTALVVSYPLERPDAIVSLASHEWERLPETARLARTYPGALVILTQPQPVTELNCHDCSGRIGRLRRMGIEDSRIVMVPLTSRGTHGEALASVQFARNAHLGQMVVVTSPYHTRRALATFRKVAQGSGIQIGVMPATATSQARPERWWGTPYDRWYVRYEWMAGAYYALRYGVDSFFSNPVLSKTATTTVVDYTALAERQHLGRGAHQGL